MNQPFASASNEKCSPPASPAFAYFAKVLARFSENNFFVAFRHQGLPFLAFRCPGFEPAKESSAPLRRFPKTFAREQPRIPPELLGQLHLLPSVRET